MIEHLQPDFEPAGVDWDALIRVFRVPASRRDMNYNSSSFKDSFSALLRFAEKYRTLPLRHTYPVEVQAYLDKAVVVRVAYPDGSLRVVKVITPDASVLPPSTLTWANVKLTP